MDNELQPAMAKAAARVLATQQQLIPKDTGAASAALRVYVAPAAGCPGRHQRQAGQPPILLPAVPRVWHQGLFRQHVPTGRPQRGWRCATNNRDKSKLKGRRNAFRQRDTKNKSDGQHFFGKYPDIPARPAHPWLRPSLDVNREYVMADLQEAVRRTLRKASQG